MTGIEFALWGAAGSFAVDGLEVTADVKKLGRWPWGAPGRPGVKASVGAFIIRALISGLVAAATGMNHTINGVFGAFAAGVAAPVIIEKLGRDAFGAIEAKPSDQAVVEYGRMTQQTPAGEEA